MISHSDYLFQTLATSFVMVLSLAIATSVNASESIDKDEPVTHTVEIQQFKFDPATLDIKVGDSIKWINRDLVPHTATASDESWDTGLIKTNESKTITFEKNTVDSYYCFYHPVMKASFKFTLSN